MRPSVLPRRGAQDVCCETCRRPLPLLGGFYRATCKRRDCPSYSSLWGRDQFFRLLSNLAWYGGRISMVSLTAPGEEMGLVWDRGHCQHPPDESCTGPGGCRVAAPAAEAWNRAHWSLWSELNREAKLRADRATGHKGGILGSSRELQGRGVFHLHIALGMETGIERAWAFAYVNALDDLGPAHMFGFVDRKPLRDPRGGRSAAFYMAKYLAKSDPHELAGKVAAAAGHPLVYVARRLTRETGVTTRALRLLRRAYKEATSGETVLWPMSDSDREALSRCWLARELTAAPRGP